MLICGCWVVRTCIYCQTLFAKLISPPLHAKSPRFKQTATFACTLRLQLSNCFELMREGHKSSSRSGDLALAFPSGHKQDTVFIGQCVQYCPKAGWHSWAQAIVQMAVSPMQATPNLCVMLRLALVQILRASDTSQDEYVVATMT